MRVKLARYRMEKAKERLVEAEEALQQNHFALTVNRSYYAMFTSARALLALKEVDSSKHSGVIALFNQHIVKFEPFRNDISKMLSKAKDKREDADYGDFVEVTQEEAINHLDNARKFMAEAEKTLSRMIDEGSKNNPS